MPSKFWKFQSFLTSHVLLVIIQSVQINSIRCEWDKKRTTLCVDLINSKPYQQKLSAPCYVCTNHQVASGKFIFIFVLVPQ